MENHPIPQDITGFQFKLIGEMTVKQFGYVVGGAIPAWLFIFVLPWPFILRAPLGIICITAGISLAFFPLSGRPMDTMIFAFLLSLFRPNQYVYAKDNSLLDPLFTRAGHPKAKQIKSTKNYAPKFSKEELTTFIQNASSSHNRWDKKELEYFNSLSSFESALPLQSVPVSNVNNKIPLSRPAPQTIHPQPPKPPITQPVDILPTTKVPPKSTDLDQTLQQNINSTLQSKNQIVMGTDSSANKLNLEGKLEAAKAKEAAEQSSLLAKNAHEKLLELEKSLTDTAMQKQQLEQELQSLKKQLTGQGKQAFIPTIAKEQPVQTQNVKMMPQTMAKSSGIPLTPEAPNLLLGIIRDPRGNALPNILIEVKDKEGNPVRAFKTNLLGNFASATPLQNGTYTIEFEDPKGENKFDTIELEAKGEIIMPIVVSSIDAREELRQSLFGAVNT